MTTPEAGQRAYEESVRRDPLYPDGTPRKPWDALPAYSQNNWAQHPTIPDLPPTPYAEWTDSMLVREGARLLAKDSGRLSAADRHDARVRLYRVANRLRAEELSAACAPLVHGSGE